jgi:hypothetical protein
MSEAGQKSAPTTTTNAPRGAAGISASFQGNASPGQAVGQTQELAPEQDHARYRQLRDKLQAELNQRSEKVAADPELDEHARDWKLNTLWDSALSADAKISELYERELEDTVAKEERKVYRIPKDLMDSTRSAYSQVTGEMEMAAYEEGDPTERLERLYNRALRTNDQALQLACYHVAVERDIHWLRDQHLETSPELSKDFENYTLARHKRADWNDKEENLIQRLDGRRGIVKPTPELR